MSTYSHSRLSTYEQCRLRYKYAYIDKIKTEIETTVEAFMGDMVHQTLEKLYKDVKFQKQPELKELLEYYNELWQKNWNEAIMIVRKDYTPENFRKMGEKFITEYFNRKKPFDQEKTLGLETSYTAEIAPGVRFHIRIDRLALKDGVYEIHDYKTSSSLPTQDQIDNDRQLTLYSYGLKKLYPDAKQIRQIWHYLAFDKDIVMERTEKEIESAKQKVLKLIEELEKNLEWPAQQSALCSWCEFKPICPEWKHQYELEDKTVEEFMQDGGVKLVNRFAELKAKCDDLEEQKEQIKKTLVAFAKKNDLGVVYGSDVKATIRSYPKLSFPKRDDPRRKDFYATLKLIGLWDQLAMPDVYELTKKINCKELHDDLIKLLDKFIERGQTDKVYLGKK